ncbi:MAG: MFS transporter [Actinobacteria bacterium]|nr:MFS transporter [Actinomycetota bacterium]
MSNTPEPARSRVITPAFSLIWLSSLAYFVAVGATLPVTPLFVDGPLRGSSFDIGLVVGVISFSAVGFRPIAGRIGDRRGRRLIIIVGAILAAGSIGAHALVGSIAELVFLRIIVGIGEAFFFTGAATVVTDVAPEDRRGEAVSFFSIALYLGLALGPVAGETILQAFSFDAVWLTSGAACLLAVVMVLPLKDTREIHEHIAPRRLIHPKALLPGIVLACSVWGFAGFSSFIPLYAREVGLGGSRFLFAMYAVVILLVRSAGAKIPDRVGPRRTAMISLLFSVLGMATMWGWNSPLGLYVSTVVFAVGQSLAYPALMTLAVAGTSASERSSVIGTFTAFLDIGFGIGPLSLGVVAQALGYRAVFLAGAGFAVIGVAVLLTKAREPRITPEPETPTRL